MFWHLSLTPVLIALLAGEDAIKFESLHDDVIVAKAMSVLRSIFGDQTVPEVTTCVYMYVRTHFVFIAIFLRNLLLYFLEMSTVYCYISWKC